MGLTWILWAIILILLMCLGEPHLAFLCDDQVCWNTFSSYALACFFFIAVNIFNMFIWCTFFFQMFYMQKDFDKNFGEEN